MPAGLRDIGGCAALIAAPWSPEVILAVIASVQILSLLVLTLNAAHLARVDVRGPAMVFRWLSLGIIVEGAMVVASKMSPVLETFLSSPVAPILIGSEKICNFFYGSHDNVYDPIKAGAVWINANTGSLFLVVAACAFMAAGPKFRSRWFYLTALVAVVGVAFTAQRLVCSCS